MDIPKIVEIIRRSDQGVTRPFLCRGEDNLLYWVKGNSAGKEALCKEWIAGRLAQSLNLPLPPFSQVDVPDELLRVSLMDDANDLGTGLAFGSEHLPHMQELSYKVIAKVPKNLKLKVLLFDWWIGNNDRCLGERGGNPNLLWDSVKSKMFIIDHNNAFSEDFSMNNFIANHIFASMKDETNTSTGLAITNEMINNVSRCSDLFRELPEEWLFLDRELSVPTGFNEDTIINYLSRIRTAYGTEWGG
ncbi:MAG: hypothetical protein PHQ23_03805 [Candidatus Wallbacteria bacterium]|nr:hypothetical protein [Candidatus Wallbacteria bacterium]